MLYSAPFGSSDPNSPFVNGNPSTGVAGSIPPAASLEQPQREIVAAIAAAGLTPSGTDLTQLTQVIRATTLNYFLDLSTAANSIVLTPGIPYLSLVAGNTFRFRAMFAPTGDTVAAINNISNVSVRKGGQAKLQGGEWSIGDIVTLVYDGVYLQLAGAQGGNTGVLITSNLTLTVPSNQYPTIQSALIACSKMIIASNALVTVNVVPPTNGVAYTETLGSNTGPIDVRIPYGNRVQVVAPALNGSFPTQSDIAGKTKSQVLSLLQSRFNCIINAVAVDGIAIHSGGLNLLENVLVVADGTQGCCPIRVGDWQNDIGTGSLGVQNVWTHGAGDSGFFAMFLAAVRVNNLGSTYNRLDGIRSAHGCNVEVNFGNILGMYNGESGAYCANDGQISIDSSSGTCDFAYNTQDGATCTASGKFNLLPATGLRFNNNNHYGVQAFGQGLINLPSFATYGGNGIADIYAAAQSYVTAIGSNPATCSPARNTNGNNNSFIAI